MMQLKDFITGDLKSSDITFVFAPLWSIHSPPGSLVALSTLVNSWGYSATTIDFNNFALKSLGADAQHVNFDEASTVKFFANFQDHHSHVADQLIETISKSNSRFISFTCYWNNRHFNKYLSRRLKQRCPEKYIIWGGPEMFMSTYKNTLPIEDGPDIVFLKDHYEHSLHLLLKGEKVEQIPGLSIKTYSADATKTSYKETTTGNVKTDLNTLPSWDYKSFNFDLYENRDMLELQISRGCPNRCIYCSEIAVSPKFHFMSAERIVDHLEHFQKNYPDRPFVHFPESAFNGNPHFNQFVELKIKRRLQQKYYSQYIMKKDFEDPSLTRAMYQSGCLTVSIGFETANKELLARTGKYSALKCDFDKIVKNLAKAGIIVNLNLMFGLPGEDGTQFQETLDFFARNKKYIHNINPSVSLYGALSGTLITKDPEKYRITLADDGDPYFWQDHNGINDIKFRISLFDRFLRFVEDNKISTTMSPMNIIEYKQKRMRLLFDYAHRKATARPTTATPIPEVQI